MPLFAPKPYEITPSGSVEIDDAVLSATEPGATKLEWPVQRHILGAFMWLAFLTLGLLGGRVFFLTVVKGEVYRGISSDNSIRSLVIDAPRGIVSDTHGTPLVRNVPSVDLVASAPDLPKEESERTVLKERLAARYQLDRSFLDVTFDELKKNTATVIPIKEKLSQEESLTFLEDSAQFPGIQLYQTAHREYIDSPVFAHLLGYEGKIKQEELDEHPDYLLTDSIGKQGIEKSYETALRGLHGFRQAEVDSRGRVVNELGTKNPVAGDDLVLNIDAGLQKKLYESMTGVLSKENLSKGAAIAIDPRNGAVRALVSIPSFDNNLFSEGISQDEYQKLVNDPARPLFNRALSGEYPPGSTIKPVIAAAALSENIISPDREIESRGGLSIGNAYFGDWRVNGFTDIRRAIAVSSDVYFYTVGGGYGDIQGLGMERMKKYENLFGYGEPTGIDFPSEAEGFIPDPAWKKKTFGERWYVGDDYNSSIGQGFVTATPLQILNAVAAIANGGTLYEPRIAQETRSGDGKIETIPPKVVRDHLISPDILKIVREGMRETVTEGTAQQLKTLPIEVAGKTGTAQFGGEEKTHGWFVSFAPYNDPQLALIVLVEGQAEEGYNAVPIASDAYQWYFGNRDEKAPE
ncbi:MAG: penicillin-binding protein 2 [Candidatus Moraniibacteriota bacterium]